MLSVIYICFHLVGTILISTVYTHFCVITVHSLCFPCNSSVPEKPSLFNQHHAASQLCSSCENIADYFSIISCHLVIVFEMCLFMGGNQQSYQSVPFTRGLYHGMEWYILVQFVPSPDFKQCESGSVFSSIHHLGRLCSGPISCEQIKSLPLFLLLQIKVYLLKFFKDNIAFT